VPQLRQNEGRVDTRGYVVGSRQNVYQSYHRPQSRTILEWRTSEGPHFFPQQLRSTILSAAKGHTIRSYGHSLPLDLVRSRITYSTLEFGVQ
jgi:hypothetical protein